jgi:hypothetical protein
MEISQKSAEEITGLKLPRSVSERRKILRKDLPYGVYVQSDGSEVLYNRDYAPIDIWGRTILGDDGKPLWVDHVSQYYFYDDKCVPSENVTTLARISEVMERKRNNPKETARELAITE